MRGGSTGMTMDEEKDALEAELEDVAADALAWKREANAATARAAAAESRERAAVERLGRAEAEVQRLRMAFHEARAAVLQEVIDETNGEAAEEFEDDAEAELCRMGEWLGVEVTKARERLAAFLATPTTSAPGTVKP